MKVYEKVDDLAGYGELTCQAHQVVDLALVDQSDWLRHRQYIIDHQDRQLGEMVIEALKRGWTASNFDRQMWSDADKFPMKHMPDWVRLSYGYLIDREKGLLWPGYHIVASLLITREDPFREMRDG